MWMQLESLLGNQLTWSPARSIKLSGWQDPVHASSPWSCCQVTLRLGWKSLGTWGWLDRSKESRNGMVWKPWKLGDFLTKRQNLCRGDIMEQVWRHQAFHQGWGFVQSIVLERPKRLHTFPHNICMTAAATIRTVLQSYNPMKCLLLTRISSEHTQSIYLCTGIQVILTAVTKWWNWMRRRLKMIWIPMAQIASHCPMCRKHLNITKPEAATAAKAA